MKKLLLTLCAAFLAATAFAADDWGTDFEKAQKEAAAKKLPIMMDFTGSDWCGWCIKLDKEVFSKKQFKTYAKKNLVLFKADFPKGKKLSKKVEAQNRELAQKYNVSGYPTIILVKADGTVIGKTGYREGGAEKYVEHIKEILSEAVPAADGAKAADAAVWGEDFEKAKAESAKRKVPILADFTGSDWCGWCIKLDKEVFSKPEFSKYAKDAFVLFKADFPNSIKQSEELKAQNAKLAKEYNVEGFPTILIIGADGKVVATTGYMAGGVEKYIENLKELAKKYKPAK